MAKKHLMDMAKPDAEWLVIALAKARLAGETVTGSYLVNEFLSKVRWKELDYDPHKDIKLFVVVLYGIAREMKHGLQLD